MQPCYFAALKGEFEAEGLSREALVVEVLFAARQGLDYLVKIGGCEAKSDLDFIRSIGVTQVTAPMVETPFACSKYMAMLPASHFHHIGVTIETTVAVSNIEAILHAGTRLTNVTIGRSDLTASYGGSGVDSEQTIQYVKRVATCAKARGLEVTMGGGVNAKTRQLLRTDDELRALIDCVETRKAVIPVEHFIGEGALEAALAVELELLRIRSAGPSEILAAASDRADQIKSRI
jgi:hypothetical protein